jgi:hypothetical protein
LAPQLTATAAAQRERLVGEGHVKVIRNSSPNCPTVWICSPGRNHDGLLAGLRSLLMSGELGQHNGLPVTIIVTTTLTDLEAAAGRGLTMRIIALRFSRAVKPWGCITLSAWPPRGSESCCTPPTAASPSTPAGALIAPLSAMPHRSTPDRCRIAGRRTSVHRFSDGSATILHTR